MKSGGNSADDTAGAGCQEVRIVGLDESFLQVNELVATAGTSASSATTTTFYRVFQTHCTHVGTYGVANTGDVTIETTGGVITSFMEAEHGISEQAMYTVPAGKTGYVHTLSGTSDSNKIATYMLWKRQEIDVIVAPMHAVHLMIEWQTTTGVWNEEMVYPMRFEEKTDVWMSGNVSTSTGSLNGHFMMLLKDN